MSEFRKDPVSGRWVIVAPERAARPTDFPVERRYGVGGFCPFCEGYEDKTPPELAALRDGTKPDGPGWKARVVSNRFPALQDGEPLERHGNTLCRRMTGFGMHEVIIETPRHLLSINEMSQEEIAHVLGLYQARMRNMRANPHLVYAMLFKNVGAAAGATIEHSHAQLMGLPVVPAVVRNEMRNASRFFVDYGECIFCKMIRQELEAGARLIQSNPHFVAFAPFAARFPFETWLAPLSHQPHFEEQPPETLSYMAEMLLLILNCLDAALGSPAYNYLIHTSPWRANTCKDYHWHMEIIPSVTRIAGFEWGTGSYINPVQPESAAAFMRQARTGQIGAAGLEKRHGVQ